MNNSLPLPDGAVLDTYDPGHHYSYSTPNGGFQVVFGPAPDPQPGHRLPRQYREHAVRCMHPSCKQTTWRADALCHTHHQAAL